MKLSHWLPTAVAALSLACGDDPFEPTLQNVAGSYTATTMTSTDGGVTTNQLAAGSSLTITLASNGTTTGRLFVPAGAGGGGSDFEADLTGTWTLVGNSVEFAHTADTFVRDMSFTASARRLQGEETFGGTSVRVTLAR